MANQSRKDAIREYKEKPVPRGAYAIRCKPTGQVWVGASRNLGATRNGSWFALRQGGHMDKTLQAEWNAHGEEAFEYEILEQLDDDLSPMAVTDLLKEKREHWIARLQARGLN